MTKSTENAVRINLAAIRRRQEEIKMLVRQIELALGVEGIFDDDLWTLGMHLDGQGKPIDVDGAMDLARRYEAKKDASR